MKKGILLILFIIFMIGVSACTPDDQIDEEDEIIESPCKDNPLGEGCYIPSEDLNHISPIPTEYLLDEDFESENINKMPRNWLLYKNEEYAVGGVIAQIEEELDGNKYVAMYSDGLRAPMYPQSAPTPTFIMTSKFNLDIARAGIAYGSVMIPSGVESNAVTLGISTGAVNTISVVIGTDLSLSVKVGGPFFYYSGTGDGGDIYTTAFTLVKDQWYNFRFEWDASLNTLEAFIIIDDVETSLFSGGFHISSRVNALANEAILVPNVFRVTMPRYMSGWAFLDNVFVERKEV